MTHFWLVLMIRIYNLISNLINYYLPACYATHFQQATNTVVNCFLNSGQQSVPAHAQSAAFDKQVSGVLVALWFNEIHSITASMAWTSPLNQAEVYPSLAAMISEPSAAMLIQLNLDENAALVPWPSYFTIPGWCCHCHSYAFMLLLTPS